MSDTETDDLSNIELLKGLEAADLKKVRDACAFKHYASQEQIIDRQSESTDVFFVLSGEIRVVIYSLSGREITLDDLSAGGYFGELAAIDGEPRSASVMALTDCVVGSLPQSEFLALLETHPQVATKVMKFLTRMVRSATDRIMDLSTLAANNRVHADLLRLARNYLGDDNQAKISPIPMHSDIASRASTTRETVARVLNDLARNGIVERQKEVLLVLDVGQLSDMVEEVRGE